jgi:hypothetical protein
MEFCCDKFKFFYLGNKSSGLNIRIVQLSKEFIERAGLTFDKSYFITEGYDGLIEDCKKKISINYCPFCGRELRKKYFKDEYVQEIMKIW